MKFSETWLKTLQPKAAAYRIFEKGHIRGFGVQVTPKGAISFFLCYQHDGLTKYRTLGKYPALSLSSARDAAILFRKTVDAGEPGGRQLGTLQQLCDAYLQFLSANSAKTVKTIGRILQNNVIDVLGADKLAKDVTPEDVRRVMNACINRDAGVMANRVRSYLMSAFKHGIHYDNDPRTLDRTTAFEIISNPVEVVPKISSFESVKERVLSVDELAMIWHYDGDRISSTHLTSLRLIILCCGLRSSEVTQAKKSEFDLANRVWNLPPPRTKNARWHAIPLTDMSLDLVERLMAVSRGKSYLFPSKTGEDKPEHSTSLGHAVARLVTDLEMMNWSPHDLRRTCKTLAGQAGLSKEIRDRLQNHSLNDVSSKHYDRYLYLNEKREALEKWELFLVSHIHA